MVDQISGVAEFKNLRTDRNVVHSLCFVIASVAVRYQSGTHMEAVYGAMTAVCLTHDLDMGRRIWAWM